MRPAAVFTVDTQSGHFYLISHHLLNLRLRRRFWVFFVLSRFTVKYRIFLARNRKCLFFFFPLSENLQKLFHVPFQYFRSILVPSWGHQFCCWWGLAWFFFLFLFLNQGRSVLLNARLCITFSKIFNQLKSESALRAWELGGSRNWWRNLTVFSSIISKAWVHISFGHVNAAVLQNEMLAVRQGQKKTTDVPNHQTSISWHKSRPAANQLRRD